jgi:hypothetical protein
MLVAGDSVRNVLAVLSLFLVSATSVHAQTSELVFENRTGSTIYFLYVSPTTSESWGQDILGAAVFADGGVFRARLRSAPAFDVRAVDSNGNEYIVWAWRPDRSRRLEIRRTAFAGEERDATAAIAWLSVVNDTNYTLERIIAIPASSGDWSSGQTFLDGRQAILNGEKFRLNIDVERFDTLVFDLMAIDEDGDTYIKWDVNLEITPEIVYTLDDIRFQ